MSEEKKQPVTQKIVAEKKKNIFGRNCKECEKLKKEVGEYKAGWQRALADYNNLQKQITDQRSEWAIISEQKILEEFIPVYDNFKKAFFYESKNNDESWVNGIRMIMKQFYDVLALHGIKEIDTVGQKFDPIYHEAVGQEESENESGVITKEVQSGYTMADKVVRAAKVIVSK